MNKYEREQYLDDLFSMGTSACQRVRQTRIRLRQATDTEDSYQTVVIHGPWVILETVKEDRVESEKKLASNHSNSCLWSKFHAKLHELDAVVQELLAQEATCSTS